MNSSQLTTLRNELYDMLPTGKVEAWDMITAVKAMFERFDQVIDQQPSYSGVESAGMFVKFEEKKPTDRAIVFIGTRHPENNYIIPIAAAQWIEDSNKLFEFDTGNLISTLGMYWLDQSKFANAPSSKEREMELLRWFVNNRKTEGLEPEDISDGLLLTWCNEYFGESAAAPSLVTHDLNEAARLYAEKHSAAPDKCTPDWIIADFKAGARWKSQQALKEREATFNEVMEVLDDKRLHKILDSEIYHLSKKQTAEALQDHFKITHLESLNKKP